MWKAENCCKVLAFQKEKIELDKSDTYTAENILILPGVFSTLTFIQNPYFFDEVQKLNISGIYSHWLIENGNQSGEPLSNLYSKQN